MHRIPEQPSSTGVFPEFEFEIKVLTRYHFASSFRPARDFPLCPTNGWGVSNFLNQSYRFHVFIQTFSKETCRKTQGFSPQGESIPREGEVKSDREGQIRLG
jgi:hypothetical protein